MVYSSTKTLLRGVRDSYTAIADSFNKSRNRPWDEFTHLAQFIPENARILDLGCGNGRLYGFLKEKIKTYVGIDNNKALLAKARANHPKARFKLGEQTAIPLADKTTDMVWNVAAFHHLPGKRLQKKALKEMRRVMAKNGLLALTVWNLWQPKYRKLINENGDAFIPFSGVPRYYHAFRICEMKKLLRENGFSKIKTFASKYNLCFIYKRKDL